MITVQDRANLWLIVWIVLALLVAVDPPFGFGPLRIASSLIAGALISLLVSRYYSERASEELRRTSEDLLSQAERLHRKSEELHSMTMRMVQSVSGGHQVAVRHDEQGRPAGLVHHVTVHDSLAIGDQVTPELRPDSGSEADQE